MPEGYAQRDGLARVFGVRRLRLDIRSGIHNCAEMRASTSICCKYCYPMYHLSCLASVSQYRRLSAMDQLLDMLLAHDVAGEFAIGTLIEALGHSPDVFTKTVTLLLLALGLRNDILKTMERDGRQTSAQRSQ